MWEGRERGGLVFRLSLPPCTVPLGANTAAALLEHEPLTRDGQDRDTLLRGPGDTWDPPSTQADAIGLDEPSARALGMVPAGSLASPSPPSPAAGHSLAAGPSPRVQQGHAAPPCFFFFFFFNTQVKK